MPVCGGGGMLSSCSEEPFAVLLKWPHRSRRRERAAGAMAGYVMAALLLMQAVAPVVHTSQHHPHGGSGHTAGVGGDATGSAIGNERAGERATVSPGGHGDSSNAHDGAQCLLCYLARYGQPTVYPEVALVSGDERGQRGWGAGDPQRVPRCISLSDGPPRGPPLLS